MVETNTTTETEFMLTTFDNPFDPFEQFTSWFLFDVEKGYYTCNYLDRIINQRGEMSDDLSQREKDAVIERAIDDIILYNPLNIYKKVSKVTTVEDVLPVE